MSARAARAVAKALNFREQDELGAIVRSVRNVEEARRIHRRIELGRCRDSRYLRNLLVEMYGKVGEVVEARAVFDRIQDPNDFSWNILVWAYATNGHFADAVQAFHSMTQRSIVSWKSMIYIYAQYGNLFLAKETLRRMPEWSLIAWNTIITAHNGVGDSQEALRVFLAMPNRDLISWCAVLAGFTTETKDLDTARELFQRMPCHGNVCSTSMLQLLGDIGRSDEAREIFDRMEERDSMAWNVMVAASASSVDDARAVFVRIPQRSFVAWTAMIQAYARSGHMRDAKKSFDDMPQSDVMAWTTLVAGYAQHGLIDEAEAVYARMPKRDVVSWTSMLEVGGSGSLDLFQQMPERNIVSWTAMVAALARRMDLASAKLVFDRMPHHSIVSWNALMAAYALSGDGGAAIASFDRLVAAGVSVNDVTFLALLTACSHLGLVARGRDYFVSMVPDFGIAPGVDHYSCMVDMLGRAGEVEVAKSMLVTMPVVPDWVAWCSVVSASKTHHDVECGVSAAKAGLELRAHDSGLNLLLSNIYFGGLQQCYG